jgi:hypothetical protein
MLPDSLLEQLKESLDPHQNQGSAFKGEDGGRSGSFFFFSHDRKFLLKTMTEDELNLKLKVL